MLSGPRPRKYSVLLLFQIVLLLSEKVLLLFGKVILLFGKAVLAGRSGK